MAEYGAETAAAGRTRGWASPRRGEGVVRHLRYLLPSPCHACEKGQSRPATAPRAYLPLCGIESSSCDVAATKDEESDEAPRRDRLGCGAAARASHNDNGPRRGPLAPLSVKSRVYISSPPAVRRVLRALQSDTDAALGTLVSIHVHAVLS